MIEELEFLKDRRAKITAVTEQYQLAADLGYEAIDHLNRQIKAIEELDRLAREREAGRG